MDEDRALIPKYTENDVARIIQDKEKDSDSYATKKSVGQGNLNTAGIQTIIALLIPVLVSPAPLTNLQISFVVLIGLSLSLQFTIFVMVIVLANSKTEQISRGCTATSLNNLVTSLTGLLVIITTAITIMSGYSVITGQNTANTTTA